MTTFNLTELMEMGDEMAVGAPKPRAATTEKREYESPFIPGVSQLIEVIGEKVTSPKFGTNMQLQLSIQLVKEDGTLGQKAGNVWIDLPIADENLAANLSDEARAEARQKGGEALHRFLRAVDPTAFDIYATLDKGTKPWTFTDHNGNVMSDDDRQARAEQVGKLVSGTAKALAAGTVSLVGKRVYNTVNAGTKPTANGKTKLWNNFSADPV